MARGVEGPNVNVFTKGDVNGARTRPTYKVVKEATGMKEIGWYVLCVVLNPFYPNRTYGIL